jgi:hypothetical protein
MYLVTAIIGLIMIILFQARRDIVNLVRSDAVRNFQVTSAIGLTGLCTTLAYKGYNAYVLYSSEWDFVFINQLNETVGIASHRSMWYQDFSGQTDYHDVMAFSSCYVRLQPLLNAMWGYTYNIRIKWNENSLFIPADLSSQTCKTFLITKDGLRLAPDQSYRAWSYKFDGKIIVFQT